MWPIKFARDELWMKALHTSSDEAESSTTGWRSTLSIAKDILPWVMLVSQLLYAFGVRESTSDRTQQQSQEDHIAIQEMRSQLSDLKQQQAVVSTKVDILLSGTAKEARDAR